MLIATTPTVTLDKAPGAFRDPAVGVETGEAPATPFPCGMSWPSGSANSQQVKVPNLGSASRTRPWRAKGEPAQLLPGMLPRIVSRVSEG